MHANNLVLWINISTKLVKILIMVLGFLFVCLFVRWFVNPCPKRLSVHMHPLIELNCLDKLCFAWTYSYIYIYISMCVYSLTSTQIRRDRTLFPKRRVRRVNNDSYQSQQPTNINTFAPPPPPTHTNIRVVYVRSYVILFTRTDRNEYTCLRHHVFGGI